MGKWESDRSFIIRDGMKMQLFHLQRSAKRLVRGCGKIIPAFAYLFCLTLPGRSLTISAHLLAGPCIIFAYQEVLTAGLEIRDRSTREERGWKV